MKFVLFVEGDTEKKCIAKFLKRWLDERLNQPVAVVPRKFKGWSNLWKDTPQIALGFLNSPKQSELIAVVALLDLYGPNIYPSHITTSSEKHDWAVREMQSRVNHPKFRMYFAVHEIEAWLLADKNILPTAVAKALPGRVAQPETINFDEPPSKLLRRLYRDKGVGEYHKIQTGFRLYNAVDPEVSRNKCPALAAMLDDMLTLAKQAGL